MKESQPRPEFRKFDAVMRKILSAAWSRRRAVSCAMLFPLLCRAGAAVRTQDVAGHPRSLWLPIKSSADNPAGRHFEPERFS